MDYTGHVTAGGPCDQRDLPLLTIRKASVSQMANNVDLLTCGPPGGQPPIDPPPQPLDSGQRTSESLCAGKLAAP